MMMFRKHKCFKKNFTLIELLVSLAVFSILLLIMMQFFSGAQRLWVASENRNNMTADARVALQVIGDLLSKAYYTEATSKTQKDIPFVIDNTADNSKLYFITDSLYQFKPSDSSNLYFVSIYRDPATDELMIRYAGSSDHVDNCFNETITIEDMCSALDGVTGKVLVPNVLGFTVKAYDSNSPTAYSGTTYKYPGIIIISLRMMSAENYKKWVDMGGKGTETTPVKEFRESVEQTFTKTIFLGKTKFKMN